MLPDFTDTSTKHTLDGFSILLAAGAVADILPAIAALLSIIWLLISIYQSELVQSYLPQRFRLARYRDEYQD